MKLLYYLETDSLYIELNYRQGADSREIVHGLVVDFYEQGNVVGIDIGHVSEKLYLGSLESSSLPLTAANSA